MAGTNLHKADLTWTNLKDASCTETIFTSATLSGADLTGANLTRADLKWAELEGVKGWKRVGIFKGVNLYGVKNLCEKDLKWAMDRGAKRRPPLWLAIVERTQKTLQWFALHLQPIYASSKGYVIGLFPNSGKP